MSAPEVITFGAIGTAGLGVLAAAGAMGVGLVFLQAALAKLRHRELLSGVIANYRLLPEALVAPAALLLAPAEIMVGAGLLLSRHWLAALAAIALLIVFAAAMGINILRGRSQIDCGCGRSQLRQQLSWLLVSRNLVLAALLVPLLSPGTVPAPGTAELAIAFAGGLAVFVIVQLFNAIGALAASPLATPRR
ncbi:MAG: MauE/DoxX family redox-associated membrane protein [Novosphingobium sp.]|uniref:MauE/DoxX family redox-associated membrane protein n=1 Tax=Novosphingobium sp. TaxID=1874826 RepID=UPI003018EFFA